jgi:translocator protein
VVIVATVIVFLRLDRIAAWCVLPLAFWVGFATVLNFAIWSLSP